MSLPPASIPPTALVNRKGEERSFQRGSQDSPPYPSPAPELLHTHRTVHLRALQPGHPHPTTCLTLLCFTLQPRQPHPGAQPHLRTPQPRKPSPGKERGHSSSDLEEASVTGPWGPSAPGAQGPDQAPTAQGSGQPELPSGHSLRGPRGTVRLLRCIRPQYPPWSCPPLPETPGSRPAPHRCPDTSNVKLPTPTPPTPHPASHAHPAQGQSQS